MTHTPNNIDKIIEDHGGDFDPRPFSDMNEDVAWNG